LKKSKIDIKPSRGKQENHFKCFSIFEKRVREISVFIFFLFCITPFYAQKSLVKAEVKTSDIRIGEQFNYSITVKEVENVILPKLELYGLEVVDSAKTDTINYMLIKNYTITGFDSGSFYIPQQQVFVRNQAYLTDSLLINVATIPVDTTKIKKYAIKAIKKEPYILDDFKIYIYLLIAALLIIGFWIYWFVIRKQKVEEEKPTYIALTPYDEAMHKLNELDEKLLWQNNKVKQYYSELTDIIRAYIERELNIPALEKTSDEIMETLNDYHEANTINTTRENINKLRNLFQEADLVKFAKSKPLATEIQEDRKDAEEVVHNLKPKPVSKDEELE